MNIINFSMKHQPPVIPFLFFVAVIITLSSIAVYAGLKYQFIRNVPPVIVNKASAQEPATTEPGEANVMEELKKDPQAIAAFENLSATYQLAKFIKVPDQGYWFQLDSRQNNKDKSELWLVDGNGVAKKVFEGPTGGCGVKDFNWELLSEEKSILLTYSNPGTCHGGTHSEINEYNSDGELMVNITKDDSSPVYINGAKIDLAFTGNCDVASTEKNPTVQLRGITIDEQLIKLNKPEIIDCAGYFDTYLLPGFQNMDYKNRTLVLELPNKQNVSINIDLLLKGKETKNFKEAAIIK